MGKLKEHKSSEKKRKSTLKKRKRTTLNRSLYDEVEEKQNNAHVLKGLKPWEKKYLGLLQWSYVHQGRRPREVTPTLACIFPSLLFPLFDFPVVKGCLNLLEPLRCEETLVRIDQDDVRAVLKIMGHNWRTDQKRGNQKKRKETKRWSTKDFDELVVSVSREEDELVRWWKNPYCRENVRKNIKQNQDSTKEPLFFKTYDVEERLWGFAQRMRTAAGRPAPRAMHGASTAGSKPLRKKKSRVSIRKKANSR